jgi:hypothetical protein
MRNVNGVPTYRMDIPDGGVYLGNGIVWIGEDAFAFHSAGWLAATIGHEAVHATQDTDGRLYFGHQGVPMNEVEAYDWELSNTARFGLAQAEIQEVRDRRDEEYYLLTPENQKRVDEGIYTLPAGQEDQ